MKSSNPILRESIIDNTEAYAITEKPMTVSGTMSKLLILSVVLFLGAGFAYYHFSLQHIDLLMKMFIGGIIISLVSCIVIAFKHTLVPYLAPVYAFCQGAVLSIVSCFFERAYHGIVMQAIFVTFTVVIVMAVLFKLRIIRATERFKSIIMLASLSIFVYYIIAFVLQCFGKGLAFFDPSTSYYYSPMAIGVNLIIAVVAACYLIIDFDFIEKGSERMLPSLYEWYGAFGLMTTIVWLYIEILRLLSRRR